MGDYRRLSLALALLPFLLTIFASLNPFVLYSYDGRVCSRADLYFGPFKIGSIELKLREVYNYSSPILSRSHDAPVVDLPYSVPLVGIRCSVNKTLGTSLPGAPEDTLGVGLVIKLPDGSKSILLCSTAQSGYVAHRNSESLGEVYECTSTRLWSALSTLKSGNFSLVFLDEDFYPAFTLMAKDKGVSLLDAEVVGVYVFSETIVSCEEGRYIGTRSSGMLGWTGYYPSHVIIDETSIPLRCGVARVDGLEGFYIIEVEIRHQFLPFSKDIRLSIEL